MRGAQLFTFRMVPAIATLLVKRGLDPRPLLRETGLPFEALTGDVTTPLSRVQELLDRAALLLERPLLGLDLALSAHGDTTGLVEPASSRPSVTAAIREFAAPRAFAIGGHAARFAPTLGQRLECFCEHAALVNPLTEWRYLATDTECAMQLSVPGSLEGLGAQLTEFLVGSALELAREGLDPPLQVTRARFAHARPAALADQIATRLGCATTFGTATGVKASNDAKQSALTTNTRTDATTNARTADVTTSATTNATTNAIGLADPISGFAFAPEDAGRAPRMADAALYAFYTTPTHDDVASHGGANGGPDDVIAHVSWMIELRLPDGDLRIEAIARALAITDRTLQRRLTDAGTSYRTVLAHVRRRRRAELHRDGIAQTRIAELLGFTDVRAMMRSLDTPDSD